jgi:hypothetical protein
MADEKQSETPAELAVSQEQASDSPEPRVLPPEAAEAIKKLPPEDQRIVETTFMALAWGPTANPIVQKMTSAHIDKALDLASQDMTLGYEDRRHARDRSTQTFLIGLGLIVALVLVLALLNRETILQWIIPAMLGAVGGFGGGYGWAKGRGS